MNLTQSPSDSPWASLWRQIGNAEWVANIGLPLAVTVVALAFAVGAFFLQQWIEHQRRTVDRRRDFAGQYADALRGFADDLGNAVTLSRSDPREVWISQLVAMREAQTRIAAATGRAARRFSTPDELRRVSLYTSWLGRRWSAWFEYADELRAEYPAANLRSPMVSAARGDMAKLRDLADTYEEWDGGVDGAPDTSAIELLFDAQFNVDPTDPDGLMNWREHWRCELDDLVAPYLRYARGTLVQSESDGVH